MMGLQFTVAAAPRQHSHIRPTLFDERSGLSCQYQSIVGQYAHKIFTLSVFDKVQGCICNIYKASFSPGSVQQIMP
jgi:hypothetical protein